MLKQIIMYILFDLVAEQQLRGCKAQAVRVMPEWVKTHCLVVSKDLSLIRCGLFLKACG
jgi:hypothetical protein